MSERKGGSVPVPNIFFDQWLPRLTDSEMRLLLVLVRATLGWREGGDHGGWRFKRRDWMTNSQLVRRTGSSSAAISRAVQSLVIKGLIRVESADGTVLDTPSKRQRNLGRLYFALGEKWITSPPLDNGAARTTTNNRDNTQPPAGSAASRRPYARPAQLERVSDLLRRPSDPF